MFNPICFAAIQYVLREAKVGTCFHIFQYFRIWIDKVLGGVVDQNSFGTTPGMLVRPILTSLMTLWFLQSLEVLMTQLHEAARPTKVRISWDEPGSDD